MPNVVPSDSTFGHLARGATALPDGIPVRAMLGDSHAALFGHGIRTPGAVKATYGTGSSLMTLMDRFGGSSHGLAGTIAWCTTKNGVAYGMVYVMSGFRGFSIQAIKLSSCGDVSETDNIVWSVRKSAPYVPSPVLSGDRLYMSKSNDAYLSCLNALTGEVIYQDQALPGVRSIYASPLAANGYLYIVGREGTVMVVKDAPQFEVVATNKLDDRIDASPVMLEKELFLRGHEHLYCISES
jgi:outer membrane protein assembly factor BamB